MKKINSKTSNKNILKVLVIFVFLFYISTFLVLSNRNYIFKESMFKSISSKVNFFFIKRMYPNNKISDDVILSKTSYLEKENNELKRLLSLKETNTSYKAAEVINHIPETFFNTLEISKGYNDGIKKGNAVITNNGLVGFINKTSKNISEVKLITSVNENDMISVLIENDKDITSGILSDYDEEKDLFIVTDCLSKSIIKQGAKVILSGYENDLYKGIYIGKVVKDEVSNHGLGKTIWVKSDVNFNDILFVLVEKEIR